LILRVKDLGFSSFPINVVLAFNTCCDFRMSLYESHFSPSFSLDTESGACDVLVELVPFYLHRLLKTIWS
jgi:hypothetical protein